MRRRLSRALVAREPYRRWNAFIDLIANEDELDLNPTQRAAQLAFRYHAEVENGGHLQYFENHAGGKAEATLPVLRSIGASKQAEVLQAALRQWTSVARQPAGTVEEYVENALEGEFDEYDHRYAHCEPSIIEALERYLDQHEAEFIEYDG